MAISPIGSLPDISKIGGISPNIGVSPAFDTSFAEETASGITEEIRSNREYQLNLARTRQNAELARVEAEIKMRQLEIADENRKMELAERLDKKIGNLEGLSSQYEDAYAASQRVKSAVDKEMSSLVTPYFQEKGRKVTTFDDFLAEVSELGSEEEVRDVTSLAKRLYGRPSVKRAIAQEASMAKLLEMYQDPKNAKNLTAYGMEYIDKLYDRHYNTQEDIPLNEYILPPALDDGSGVVNPTMKASQGASREDPNSVTERFLMAEISKIAKDLKTAEGQERGVLEGVLEGLYKTGKENYPDNEFFKFDFKAAEEEEEDATQELPENQDSVPKVAISLKGANARGDRGVVTDLAIGDSDIVVRDKSGRILLITPDSGNTLVEIEGGNYGTLADKRVYNSTRNKVAGIPERFSSATVLSSGRSLDEIVSDLDGDMGIEVVDITRFVDNKDGGVRYVDSGSAEESDAPQTGTELGEKEEVSYKGVPGVNFYDIEGNKESVKKAVEGHKGELALVSNNYVGLKGSQVVEGLRTSKDNGGHLVFSNPADGWTAALSDVTSKLTGKSRHTTPSTNLYDMLSKYVTGKNYANLEEGDRKGIRKKAEVIAKEFNRLAESDVLPLDSTLGSITMSNIMSLSENKDLIVSLFTRGLAKHESPAAYESFIKNTSDADILALRGERQVGEDAPEKSTQKGTPMTDFLEELVRQQ